MQRFWQDIGDFVFVEDAIESVDCLIVLGAPWSELIEHVTDLYHHGIANTIYASGKYGAKSGRVRTECLPKEYQRAYRTESEMLKDILSEHFNVPAGTIIEEPNSTNTYENALFTMHEIAKMDYQRIGICCQAFHARRAQMTFQSIAPDFDFLIFPAETQGIGKDNWFETDYGRRRVFGELERCGKFFPMEVRCSVGSEA